MKKIFFVTGFPRSRTAWLATLFTWGDCFCFHDGLANVESLDELDAKFNSVPGGIVGNSDPANLLFHDALMKRYPDAKWIIIERPIHDSAVSMFEASGFMLNEADLFEQMSRLKGRLTRNALAVSFDFLDDVGVLRELTDFIGVEMPIQRFHELRRLNIRLESLRNVSLQSIYKMNRFKASIHECVLA